MESSVAILDAGVLSPIGLTAEQVASSVRAGISRVRDSSILDRLFQPLKLGYLAQDVLPPLKPELEDGPGGLRSRMLQLAGPALQELALKFGQPLDSTPVLIGLPELDNTQHGINADRFLQDLVIQSGVAFSPASKIISKGHASVFWALQEAVDYLKHGHGEFVVVGGVDSYLDLLRLEVLQQEGRVHSDGPADGFVPGEGAAFLLLAVQEACERVSKPPLAFLSGLGIGTEDGHRYSSEPYLGEGLAGAFAEVFEGAQLRYGLVKTVFAGLNGESFHTKEMNVAHLRNAEFLDDALVVEHPAEYFGDAGAALAPKMMALAAIGLHSDYLEGPALVWASSERAERGAALLAPACKEHKRYGMQNIRKRSRYCSQG